MKNIQDLNEYVYMSSEIINPMMSIKLHPMSQIHADGFRAMVVSADSMSPGPAVIFVWDQRLVEEVACKGVSFMLP